MAGIDLNEPGGPGAAAPSSPGGSDSHTLDSSSASAFSAFPLPSSTHLSEAHSEARHTLSPGKKATKVFKMIKMGSTTRFFILNKNIFNQKGLKESQD